MSAPASAASAAESAASGAGTDDGTARGGRGRGDEGAGLAAVGHGSLTGQSDDYLEKLRRWISRFRKSPDDSCKQLPGTLGITIARDGTVLDVTIEKSSGCPLSDKAALDTVRAASPVPPLPSYIAGNSVAVSMPFSHNPSLFERLFR
jgi:protein TonB